MLEYRIYQCINKRCGRFRRQVPIHLLDEICPVCGRPGYVTVRCLECDEPMLLVRLSEAWEAALLADTSSTS